MANDLGQPIRFPRNQEEMEYYQENYTWDPATNSWYKPRTGTVEEPAEETEERYGPGDIRMVGGEYELYDPAGFWRAISPGMARTQLDMGARLVSGTPEPPRGAAGGGEGGASPPGGTTEVEEPTEGTTTREVTIPELPKDISGSDWYKALTPEHQQLAGLWWKLLYGGRREDVEEFNEALDIARDQAGPYWREKINIMKDALVDSVTFLQEDLEAKEADISRRRKEIEEDLLYNREYLTVEEQAELKRRQLEYDVALEDLRADMANRGLTFSTIRSKARERLEERHEDVVESTQREYAKKLRDLGISSERDIEDLQSQLEDIKRATEYKKRSKVRGVEEYLGTEKLKDLGELPDLDEYLMGGIGGELYEEREWDIFQRAQALTMEGL